VAFYGAGNVPPVHAEVEAFILREKASIEDMQRHLWPSPKDPTKGIHPDRWTGKNLFEDVVAADAAYGDQIRANLGVPLAEYYRTEYRRMNWLIHSTMAGITNLDRIYYSTAAMLALKWSQDLAMFCTKMTLSDQQFHDAIDDLNAQWRGLREERDRNYERLMREYDAGGVPPEEG
jgi:hypothetical protein